jgi:Kef-type K+ transport system membrane component KefB
MSEGLILVLVVAASYLAARVAFEWLARRYVIVSGAEYLLLGILLGPQVSRILSPEAVESFAPITSLGLGWMGALIGAQLVLPRMVRTSAVLYRVALVESCLTFAFTSALMAAGLYGLFDIGTRSATVAGIGLGSVATVSATAGVGVVARQLGRRSPVVQQLEVASATNAVVAILASGLLFAIVHPDPNADIVGRPLTPTEWAVITIAVGVIGGALFHLFVGEERNVDRLFVSLAGAVILVSGAATYLRLSPLLAALCFGFVLANTTRARTQITVALERVERPLYFALLVLAGATWRPSVRDWVLPVLLFLLVRIAAKIGAARLAARWNGVLPALGPQWGRGLLGQGGLALAVALSYLYQEDAPLASLVFTAAVASVLLTDVMSARFVRSLVYVDPAGPEAPADA